MFTESLLKTPQKMHSIIIYIQSGQNVTNIYVQTSSAHWPNYNKPIIKNISTSVIMNTTYMIYRREVDGIRVSL